MVSILSFVKEVRGEFANIVWPTRRDAIRLSLIVVLVSVAIGAFVGALDFGFTNAIRALTER